MGLKHWVVPFVSLAQGGGVCCMCLTECNVPALSHPILVCANVQPKASFYLPFPKIIQIKCNWIRGWRVVEGTVLKLIPYIINQYWGERFSMWRLLCLINDPHNPNLVKPMLQRRVGSLCRYIVYTMPIKAPSSLF
ncbi:hypothetical protein XELAEV_18036651mg [Xenopus laevis]|uniref:Uncharacterized protein n=1 Tax=Xenopus laevis TaxID=8355 RepID=A0A974CAV9_XENLA|nr:hypothetical protein XELAEV_18036651mg [Xenopus laevis]